MKVENIKKFVLILGSTFAFSTSIEAATARAKSLDLNKVVRAGISPGFQFVNITENEHSYFVIDTSPKLTRINKVDGGQKSIRLPEIGEFGRYVIAELSDDKKTLFTFADRYAAYVDLENMKLISKIEKDTSSLPYGFSRNVYQGTSIRKNGQRAIVVGNVLDAFSVHELSCISLLNEATEILSTSNNSNSCEVNEAYLVPSQKEIWAIVNRYLVVLDAKSEKGKFALKLNEDAAKNASLNDYSVAAGHFVVETSNGQFSVVALKSKKIVKTFAALTGDRVFSKIKYVNNGQHLAFFDGAGRLLALDTQKYEIAFDSKASGLTVKGLLGGNNKSYNFLMFEAQNRNAESVYAAFDFEKNQIYTLSTDELNGHDVLMLNDFKLVGRTNEGKSTFYSVDFKNQPL